MCVHLFYHATLAQKIMHTRKRHQDMFQDLNRKLQHAEKDRESPPVDSKPGKRWSVSSGGSDKTNLSVSFLANLLFFLFSCTVTHILLISLIGWRNIKRLSGFLVWCVSGGKFCFSALVNVSWIPSLLFGSDKIHCDLEAEKASCWEEMVQISSFSLLSLIERAHSCPALVLYSGFLLRYNVFTGLNTACDITCCWKWMHFSCTTVLFHSS